MVDRLLRSLDIRFGDFDRVSIAGGASPRNDTIVSLELSGELHSPSVFILTAHEDCGAGTTLEDLRKVLADVRRAFPDKQVSAFWVKLNWSWDEVS